MDTLRPKHWEVAPGCSHPPLKQLEGRTGMLSSRGGIMSVSLRGAQQDENGWVLLFPGGDNSPEGQISVLCAVTWSQTKSICMDRIGGANGYLLLEK